MTPLRSAGKAVLLSTLAATVGVGAVAGMVAERALIGRNVRRGGRPGENFGSLHTEARPVLADDGLHIHAEVEEAIAEHGDITVVFAHGYALTMDSFHFQRRDLRGIARLVFYDQRGHGRTPRGERNSHTLPQLASDLEQVIEQLAPTGDIVLVGHSMGGMTVQEFAKRRPELFGTRIKAVVLVCTSPGGMSEVSLGLPGNLGSWLQQVAPMITTALHGKQEIVDKSRETASDLMLLFTRRYSFGTGATPELTDFVASMHGRTKIEVITDFLHAIGEYDAHAQQALLGRVPVYVIGAEADLMTPPAHSRALAAAIPGAELTMLPDTGHMLQLERYVELNDLLNRALRRVRGART